MTKFNFEATGTKAIKDTNANAVTIIFECKNTGTTKTNGLYDNEYKAWQEINRYNNKFYN